MYCILNIKNKNLHCVSMLSLDSIIIFAPLTIVRITLKKSCVCLSYWVKNMALDLYYTGSTYTYLLKMSMLFYKIENGNWKCVKHTQNCPRPQMGNQHNKKILHQKAGFKWPLNKNVY